jgi:PAS domain S-box-containing protein
MLGNPTVPLLWSTNGASPDQRSLSAWCAYTGQHPAAVQNWRWLDALHPDDRAAARQAWEKALRQPRPITLSYRIRHAHTGEYLSFKALHVPLFSEEHQLQAWLIFLIAKSANPPAVDEDWEIRLIYGMIYEQVVLGIFCLSLDGKILRVNDRLSQLTGYTQTELLQMSIWQLSLPEDLHLHLQAMRERLTSQQSYPSFCTRYLRKDGTPVWVRVTQFLVRQPSGEPYYFFYVVEDVSAQVQAEQERAELLARAQEAHMEAVKRSLQLEAIFESITDGVMVCDSHGNVIHLNAAVRSLLHLEACPDFLALPFEQRMKLLKIMDEQGNELPLEQCPLTRILRGEYLQASKQEDMRLILPDGQEIYVNHSGAPMRNEEGEIIGAVIIIHDVNERHLLEHRIQKSFKILLALAEELATLPKERSLPTSPQKSTNGQPSRVPAFETAAEYLVELTCQMMEYQETSISLIDPDSGHLHMIALAGLSPEEKAFSQKLSASTTLADYLREDEITLLCANEVVIKESSPRSHDFQFYNVLIAPMLFNGRLVGLLTVEKREPDASYSSEEISLVKAIAKLILLVVERERLQSEWIEAHSSELALRETNRRFDEFLSIASHELRTPLAGIKGNIQLALRRLAALKSGKIPEISMLLDKFDKLQGFLREAEQRVNVQNRMISDLLDVSRIQANKLELVMGPCSLDKIVRQAIKDQRYNTPARTIILKTPGNDPLMVIGDADRLGQVVHNYLSNALKYSPADQPITVAAEKFKDSVRVSVIDKGPGLTPEEQKYVWERFYRVKGIPAQGGTGPSLGLGLHICRTIIEAHHGGFGLESTPSQGSTFWFDLPLAQSLPPASEQSANTLQQTL